MAEKKPETIPVQYGIGTALRKFSNGTELRSFSVGTFDNRVIIYFDSMAEAERWEHNLNQAFAAGWRAALEAKPKRKRGAR